MFNIFVLEVNVNIASFQFPSSIRDNVVRGAIGGCNSIVDKSIN